MTYVGVVDASRESVFTKNVYNGQMHTIYLSLVAKEIYTIQMMSTNVYMKQVLIIE